MDAVLLSMIPPSLGIRWKKGVNPTECNEKTLNNIVVNRNNQRWHTKYYIQLNL